MRRKENLAEAQTRKESALADLREMEARKVKGELVEVSEVSAQWSGVCTQIRDAVLSIPSKVSGKLCAMNDERRIADLLRTTIRGELSRISIDLDKQSRL